MNLNLERKYKREMSMKGDILVFQAEQGRKMYYLVIEDVPNGIYTLLNLEGNNIMSSIVSKNPNQILKVAKERFCKLEYIGTIPADEFELKRLY
ncbi:hypothetical protein CN984_12160 [Bacillus cereus]|uniref:Uncharacterized protein n=1 Tax=Bacillus cereus TaxID=1396 RepID=A0A2B9Q2R4_BACCE|nr:hypothetical protein [Bacillus cereus]PEA25826.1 hypothetical protein CON44_17935 [Bacillus cereus]PGO29193.1 hypothetical protein CN984_12160 [Bacillus cereus]